MRLTRDTERMVLSDIIYAAGVPAAWALIPEPTDKERRFCERIGVRIIEADIGDLMATTGAAHADTEVTAPALEVGC